MMTCRHATTLISKGMDQQLPVKTRMALRIHLFMCKYCSRYSRQLSTIREMASRYADHMKRQKPVVGLSLKSRQRIKKALRELSSE